MELSKLFMIAAVTKGSYDQCRALLTDSGELTDDVFLLICRYSLTLAKTFDILEEIILNHTHKEQNDYVTINNAAYLKSMVAKCARLEDKISERINLTIH